MRTYEAIIEHAAAVLRARMHEAVQAGRAHDLKVFAVHTNHLRDGHFHIDYEPPAGLDANDYSTVRPFGARTWSGVPYARMAAQLWHQARSARVLPVSRSPALRRLQPRYAYAA